MMDKKELLKNIQDLASQRAITKEEIISAFEKGTQPDSEQRVALPQKGISHILFYIGGAILFLGISNLIWQHWTVLSKTTKILSTLGAGIAAYITAVFLSRDKRLEVVSRAFYFISALVMPLGLQVTFYVAGFDIGRWGIQSIISSILLTTFLLSYFFVGRKTVFVLFNIIFGVWLFFAFTGFLVSGRPGFGWEFFAYCVLFTGATLVLLGYYLTETPHRALTGALYGFGVFSFLGAALALGKWVPQQNIFWELIFPGLTFGIMFLGVDLKSRSFLTFGSFYLIAYILKITAEYFVDVGSLGWPLVLVLMGLGLIAVGYLHFNLKRKYLSQS